MGVIRGGARLLLEEARRRPLTGSVLQFGRNTIYFSRRELEGWARRDRVELAPGVPTRLSHNARLAAQGCIDDITFFRLLGFETVESCDISAWEGATHTLDLNEPIPAHLAGRYDAVFDPGTIVQVFDLPRVLASIHAFLKPGGRVLHAAVPSNNHVDLGFYMASPTLFADFYAANGWALETQYLCEYFPYWHRGRLRSGPWKVRRYRPGCLDPLSYGRMGGKQLAVFVVATRSEGARGDVKPQLGQYRRRWEVFAEHAADPGMVAGDSLAEGLLARLQRRGERLFDRHPWLDPFYLPIKRLRSALVRRGLGRRMPPLVGRY